MLSRWAAHPSATSRLYFNAFASALKADQAALLARRGKTNEAAAVWWRDVIDQFLLKETKAIEGDAKRPYWLARTLLDLGDLQEKLGRLEEAKASYRLVLEKKLPYGGAVARARLEQFGVNAAKPSP